MKKTIGIIGGMGAFAGTTMAHYLVEEAAKQGAVNDEDFPHFLLYSPPIQGLTEHGVKNFSSVENQIVDALRRLDEFGCDYCMIACNTVHYILPVLQMKFSGKIISLVDCAVDAITEGPIGILCSDTAKSLELYERAIKERGLSVVCTTESEQHRVTAGIEAVIRGKHAIDDGLAVRRIITSLALRGAKQIILGCTELPLLVSPSDLRIPLIDPGREAVRKALSLA